MKALFVELPAFERLRETYFNEASLNALQYQLMNNPEAGDVIRGTGGLRKIRCADRRRGKGKRSGLRVIYFGSPLDEQFWLFTVYDKDEATDLTPDQCRALKLRLESEILARRK